VVIINKLGADSKGYQLILSAVAQWRPIRHVFTLRIKIKGAMLKLLRFKMAPFLNVSTFFISDKSSFDLFLYYIISCICLISLDICWECSLNCTLPKKTLDLELNPSARLILKVHK
jgi:hypothetical protein